MKFKFKIGQHIRIKSFEEIMSRAGADAQKYSEEYYEGLDIDGFFFNYEMKERCGKTYKIRKRLRHETEEMHPKEFAVYILKETDYWRWHEDWLDDMDILADIDFDI